MRSVGKAGIVDSLRVGEFRALWSAETVSIFGDQLARVALAILVFDRTSSALLTALTYALTFVPTMIGGLLLSGLADRYPRKKVMVITDLLRALLAASMAIPGVPLPVLWGLIGVLTMAAAPFKAAQLALLPQVLEGDRYQAGLAVRQMSIQTAQVVGFGAGGFLVAALSPGGALLIDAATFAASAAIVVIGVRSRSAARDNTVGAVPEGRSGFDPRLAAPFVLGGLIGLFVVPEGLSAPYTDVIGAGTIGVGLLMAADPIGSVVGAWWAARTRRTTPPTPRSVIVPAALAGLPLAACAFAPGITWLILLWAVSGAFSTVYLIRLQPMIVAIVPDARRGSVMGKFSTCVSASQGVAIFGGGLLADRVGPVSAVVASGALAVVLVSAVAVVWKFARPRQVRTAEDEPDANTLSNRSDLLVTHSDLLPERPGERGAGQGAAASGKPGPSRGNGSVISMQAVTPTGHQGRPSGVTGWSVWSHSVYARVLVLVVEMAAFGAVAVSAFQIPIDRHELVGGTVVACSGLLAAELARQVERRRRRFADTPHVNFSSVWTLAAALVLSPTMAAVVALILYAHLWIRMSRGAAGGYLSRFVFNAANVILSCQVAAWCARQLHLVPMNHELAGSDAFKFAAVIVVYFTVNSAIAASMIALVRPDRTARQLLGPLSENILEFATLCMGTVTALLLSWHPAFVILTFPPLYALHRSVLIRQLEHAATTDSKTGLLNSTAWHSLAEAEFTRARRNGTCVGVLMIDLDHFRRINNQIGHLAGDKALRAVAGILQAAVPGDDLCGRFGGEEFVVMLPDSSRKDVERAANGICRSVFEAHVEGIHDHETGPQSRLSVSIGAALFPSDGISLEEILLAADVALFAAKDAGRNQARVVEPTS